MPRKFEVSIDVDVRDAKTLAPLKPLMVVLSNKEKDNLETAIREAIGLEIDRLERLWGVDLSMEE